MSPPDPPSARAGCTGHSGRCGKVEWPHPGCFPTTQGPGERTRMDADKGPLAQAGAAVNPPGDPAHVPPPTDRPHPALPRTARVSRRAHRPDVSVCIVNWNCRALLRACLRSLRPRRQGVRLEVVVVDNGSTDGAADMVARAFPDVVLVRNPTNSGFARAK